MTTKKDAQDWWVQPENQKETINLMKKFGNIQTMFADVMDNEIVVKVVTLSGREIGGFPKDICGKKVVMGGFEILKK